MFYPIRPSDNDNPYSKIERSMAKLFVRKQRTKTKNIIVLRFVKPETLRTLPIVTFIRPSKWRGRRRVMFDEKNPRSEKRAIKNKLVAGGNEKVALKKSWHYI